MPWVKIPEQEQSSQKAGQDNTVEEENKPLLEITK